MYLIDMFQDEYSSPAIQQLTTECLKLKTSGLDILQLNLLKLLPLPKTAMPGRWHPPSEAPSKSVKRKRIRSDIYDSEASDDESIKQADMTELPLTDTKSAGSTKCDTDTGEESSAPTKVQQDHAGVLQDQSQKEALEANSGLDTEAVTVVNAVEKKIEETAAVALSAENSCGKKVMEDDTSASSAGSSTTGRAEGSSVESSEQCRTVKGEVKKNLKGSRKCTDGGLGSELLRSFAVYCESLSAIDSDLNDQQPPPAASFRDGWSLLPGIEDTASREERESRSDWLREEMKAELDVRVSRCLWQSVDCQVSSWKRANSSDGLPEGCSIPVSCPDVSSFSKLDFTSEATAVRFALFPQFSRF